ncbi:MAG: hypothetical protein O2964_02655 [Verrucomicrobia bacterium]|jgi:hypothetical protein|nr:hypothetical protein [Verrucomicrobiota bacterium]
MSSAIIRIIVGAGLMLTPFIYHTSKMSGEAGETFQQSQTLILFGKEISKSQYFGLLGVIAVLGIIILALGIKEMAAKKETA